MSVKMNPPRRARNQEWKAGTEPNREWRERRVLEPVTSAVTGQRSNQLSYAPAMGKRRLREVWRSVKFWFRLANIPRRLAECLS